jgi:hypothetical protein
MHTDINCSSDIRSYPLLAYVDAEDAYTQADANMISKNHYPHMRIWIAVLGYEGVVPHTLYIYIIYQNDVVLVVNTKMTSFWIRYTLCLH